MNPLSQLEPDGLPMRDSRQYVDQKLGLLKYYIDLFSTSMKSKWPLLRYIDLFAGPGKCYVDNRYVAFGSPLIALSTRFPFGHYIFVDMKQSNLDALKERAQALNPAARIDYHAGDCNKVVSLIKRQIEDEDRSFAAKGVGQSLNLAFIDPEGLELNWSTVETLASISKMDLIINYSDGGLTRNFLKLLKSGNSSRIDSFFGDTAWRKIYEANSNANRSVVHRALVDHYMGKLNKLGYKQVDPE